MKLRFIAATAALAAAIAAPLAQQEASSAPVQPNADTVKGTAFAKSDATKSTSWLQVDPPWVPGSQAMTHLQKFQNIASSNGGNRGNGTSGAAQTQQYIISTMKAAGFTVTTQRVQNGGMNIIADRAGRDESKVIAAGAHLDSVAGGPGINDDGSGVAALLTAAQNIDRQKATMNKHVRFLFFDAEEVGMVGSRVYARSLPNQEARKMEAYLNLDMVGRANPPQWGVYEEGPQLNTYFKQFFTKHNVKYRTIDPAGRSDHANLAAIGVPVTGIDSNGDMSRLEPCYHRACDDISNVSAKSMEISTNALLDVVYKLAGAQSAAR